MIFSRQQMETLTAYVTVLYDKALLVNFYEDTYQPIKMSEKEWAKVDKTMPFSLWIRGFVDSEYSKNAEDLKELANLKKMRENLSPIFKTYQKYIAGEYHDVQLELYPIGNGLAYLVVRDLTKIKNYKGE